MGSGLFCCNLSYPNLEGMTEIEERHDLPSRLVEWRGVEYSRRGGRL